MTNIECVLDHLLDACPNLEAISLAGKIKLLLFVKDFLDFDGNINDKKTIFVSIILEPTGWKEFTGDHLAYLVEEFKSIQRIDLSSVNVSISTRYKTSAQNNIGSCFLCFSWN